MVVFYLHNHYFYYQYHYFLAYLHHNQITYHRKRYEKICNNTNFTIATRDHFFASSLKSFLQFHFQTVPRSQTNEPMEQSETLSPSPTETFFLIFSGSVLLFAFYIIWSIWNSTRSANFSRLKSKKNGFVWYLYPCRRFQFYWVQILWTPEMLVLKFNTQSVSMLCLCMYSLSQWVKTDF